MDVEGPTPYVANPTTNVAQYERLVHNVTNHPPKDGTIVERLEAVRDAALLFGGKIIALVPDGREKSLAITAIEEALMWARAGIARNQ
jgi:hypothetical protein